MSELYIFPDTNVLMHYARPDQIDWCTLSDARKVILTLAPVVIGELDKHKNQHPIRRLKDRAREIASWMRLLEDGAVLKPGVSVEFLVREPAASFFSDGLDPGVADDRIIACMLEWATSGHAVAVATNDTLLSRKVWARDIRWIEVPERHRLKEEPDPLKAENARLKRENHELVHRLPKPVLRWTEDQERKALTVTLAAPDGDLPPRPDQMRILRQPLPPRNGPTSEDPWARLRLGMLSDSDIVVYNKQLSEFYDQYERYYEEELQWRDRSRRILDLNFSLGNQGTSSANDVTVTMTFPERLRVIQPKQLPARPDRPQPPAIPQPGVPGGLAAMMTGATAYASPLDIAALFGPKIDVQRPILNVDRNSVRFDLLKLQHGWVTELDPVCCVADPSLIGSAAVISIEISADELPAAVTGELVLKVTEPGRPSQAQRRGP